VDAMDMNERKQKILRAIVDEYIGTAEPVGSRAISKKNELGLSSATIRNEMADLEEMGYLMQPHASSGRVPSDIGYRFYVNSLLHHYQASMEAISQIQKVLEDKVNQLDVLIKKASMITSSMTDYTAFVTTPELTETQIKKIDLVGIGGGNVLIIVVTQTGTVRNQMINVDMEGDGLSVLEDVLNKRLCGLSADEITLETINHIQNEIQDKLGLTPKTLIAVLNFVYEVIEGLDSTEIYVNNVNAILKHPEYNDVEKARRMLTFFEDTKNLRNVISEKHDSGISVMIGSENPCNEMKDCSLVTVDYSLGDKKGKIGVIGPKRMNYAKVFSSLDCISKNIDKILHELYNTE
jgi:heat-inducible transcriptional repressor